MARTFFISGHLDLTEAELVAHYVPQLEAALAEGGRFVVGDARGCDLLAQTWLAPHAADVRVFHMFAKPRNHVGGALVGGFASDDARDAAMSAASDTDIAWVRPGRERSGTARNLDRRSRSFGQR